MKKMMWLRKPVFHQSARKCGTLLLMAIFTALYSFAQTCDEGQIVKLQGAETITLDGIGSEVAWSRVKPNIIRSTTVPKLQPDFAGTNWKAMWDATYLYVLVDVKDNTIKAANGPSPTFYQFDAVEIFVDGDFKTPRNTTYDANDHQYGFSHGTSGVILNPTGVTNGPNNQVPSTAGIDYAVRDVIGGYVMEIRIMWTTIGGITPAAGGKIGFDVAIDDNDGLSGGRDAQVSWHASDVDEYMDPSAFASAPLVDCTPEPLNIDVLSIDLTCSGLDDGTISVQGKGGVAPYTYQFNGTGAFSAANNFRNLAAGSYTVTVQDAATPPVTKTSAAIVLKAFKNNIVLSADKVIVCSGAPAVLTATGGTNYRWTANPAGASAGMSGTTGANITVKPTVKTVYYVTDSIPTNLIVNPGFESGNIGFTSDYTYLGPAQLPTNFTQEVYGIVAKSTDFNTFYTPAFFDHTTGTATGKMLVADGAIENDPTLGSSPILPANARVWSQTISVTPNTNYTFSYWLQQGNTTAPQASMQTKINGTVITGTATNPNPVTAKAGWNQITYTWNSGAATTAVIALYDLSKNENGNDLGIDDLSFTTSCSPSQGITIDVDPAPAMPSLQVTEPTCTDATGTITVTSPTTGLAAAGYSFDNGANYQEAPSKAGLPSGNYSILVKSAIGCLSAVNDTIIKAQPQTPADPQVSVTNPTCNKATGSITVINPTTGVTYSYVSTDNFTGTNPSAPLAGGITYQVRVKNADGCISNPTPATINAQPTLPPTPQTTVQNPDCTLATGKITVTNTATGYLYSYDKGANFTTNTTSDPLTAGSYDVTIQDGGCNSLPATVVIAAQPETPLAPVTTHTNPTCTSATGTITVTDPASGVSYRFSNSSSFQNGATSGNLVPGPYDVVVKNAAGCISPSTTVVIDPQPSIPLAPSVTTPVNYCKGDTLAVPLTANATGTNILLWYTSAGDVEADSVPPVPSTLAGGSTVYYVSQSSGCEGPRATITVNVNDVTANAGDSVIRSFAGMNVILNGKAGSTFGSPSILWSPANSVSDPTIAKPTIRPVADQMYILTVSATLGSTTCVAKDTTSIIILQDIIVPNVFTPNGDLIHDTWVITNLNLYPEARISIFNRYGQAMYETTGGAYKPWDGKFKGGDAPVGVYYYVIDPGFGVPKMSGSVSIIR